MKLTVLGCWAPYPRAKGACSSYLLQAEENNVLIDCGNGSFSRLQSHFDFRRLDALILTHLHADHYMDIFCLVHAIRGSLRDGSRKGPLKVFMPDSPGGAHKSISKYKDELDINLYRNLKQDDQGPYFNLGSCSLRWRRTKHPIEAYAFSLENKHKFIFSADTAWDDGLPQFIQGADLFLCEASLLAEDASYTQAGHMTAGEAGRMAKVGGAKRLLLTHFWPEYDLTMISKEAAEGAGFQPEMACEGKIYKI